MHAAMGPETLHHVVCAETILCCATVQVRMVRAALSAATSASSKDRRCSSSRASRGRAHRFRQMVAVVAGQPLCSLRTTLWSSLAVAAVGPAQSAIC